MSEKLTPRERMTALVLALLCAATRFLAMARSLWDWDEALFVQAMREYDVTLHHPHPPGFPVYIAMGKMLRLLVSDDFRALQAVNLIASMLVFPAVFFLARELRLSFRTSAIAATLFAFFPNVWFFGGGAFSDIPSIVLVLFAITLLFRGAESRNAYWAGTLLLALAIGIRPQNFLLGLFPGIYATRKRRPLEVATALAIGIAVVGIAFGSAIAASDSPESYLRVVREHKEYISRVDSWRSPVRPPMWRLFHPFFIKQYQAPALSILVTLFVIYAVVRSIRERDRAMLFNVLTFGPFALVAWAMLDRFSVSRFSIGYQPMFALLAAEGIRRAARRYEVVAATIIIGAFIVYTYPALAPVRNEIAPSVMAARGTAARVRASGEPLFVGHTMTAFMDLYAPDVRYTAVMDDRALPLAAQPRALLLAEVTKTPAAGSVWNRERGHLWNIARRHYFRIKLEPLSRGAQFASGWYGPETSGADEWRWMGSHSVTILPPARQKMMLRMHFGVPAELSRKNPVITVTVNGAVVDRFQTSDGYIERDYKLYPAPGNGPNVLELGIDRTVRAADDPRELGLRVRYLGWGPA